jgi:uncharacterized membrane protein YvlD (DUF360 family)
MAEKVMNIKEYFKNFFKTRRIGWYLCLCAVPLMLIGNIIYRVSYSDMDMQRFFSVEAYAVLYAAIVLVSAISLLEPVEKWAPIAAFALTLCSFCLFVNGTYMYLSSVFFGGVTAEALASLNAGFVATIVFQFLAMIVSLVALFLPHEKKQKTDDGIKESADTVKATVGEETAEGL